LWISLGKYSVNALHNNKITKIVLSVLDRDNHHLSEEVKSSFHELFLTRVLWEII